MPRVLSSIILLVLTMAVSQPLGQGQPPGTANGEWPNYNGDIRGSRYSPLDQINASNFNKLEVAWRFKTDNFGPRPEYKLEGTPLMVKGTLYATAGTRRSVVALNARTGEVKWVYAMDEGRRAEMAPRVLSGRGLSYWTDGKGDERIIYVTIGYRLVQLNAKTGQPMRGLRQGRRGRPEGRRGLRQAGERQVAAGADPARRRRDRHQLDAAGGRRRHHRAVGDGRRAALRVRQQRQGPRARLRRAHRQAALAVRHDAAARASPVTKPGRTTRGTGPATPACGPRCRPIRRRGWSTCPSSRPRSTPTAATGRATTSTPRAWWRST